MKWKITAILVLLAAILFGPQPALAQTSHQHGQDNDLRSGQLRPRIGVMSEVVARQKLVTYGVTDIRELKLVGNRYVIKAKFNNQPVELEMHAQTGFLTEKGATIKLPVAASVQHRMIKDRQIKVERPELVRPERIPKQ